MSDEPSLAKPQADAISRPPSSHAAAGAPDNPSVPRRVWSGTALQVLGRLFGAAATFGTLLILARHLSGPEFGRYTFYIAVFMVLDAIADFGTGAMSVQRTSTRPGEVAATLKTARRLRLCTASSGLLLLIGFAVGTGESGALWISLAALYPLTHSLELSTVPFKNRIDWRMPVQARLAASAFRLGLVVTLWRLDVQGAGPYVLATAVGSSLANFLIHFAARRELRSLPHRDAPPIPWWPFFKSAAPLGLAGLAQQAYFYIDNLFVRPMVGEEPLGYYNASVRLMSFGIMIAQYASLAALPWFARRAKEGLLGPAVARLGQPLFLGAAILSGLAIPHTAWLLSSLFRPAFAEAATSMALLLGAMAVIYFGSLHLTAVIALGYTRTASIITVGALLINVVGNALLVPRYGIDGAAFATVVTEGAVALLAALALVRAGMSSLAFRPWLWLCAPLAGTLAWWLSSQVTLG